MQIIENFPHDFTEITSASNALPYQLTELDLINFHDDNVLRYKRKQFM